MNSEVLRPDLKWHLKLHLSWK